MFHVKHSYDFSGKYLRETWPKLPRAKPVALVFCFLFFVHGPRYLTRYSGDPKQLKTVRGPWSKVRGAGYMFKEIKTRGAGYS